MSKKILFMSGHSRSAYKWGMVGELAKRLMENPDNKIFYLDCDKKLNGYCGLNKGIHWNYCNACSKKCLEVLKFADFPEDKIIKIKKVPLIKFPKFKNIDEIIKFDYDGYNYGIGPASCLMTITRDCEFDVNKYRRVIEKFLENEYTLFKNLEEYHKTYHFDEIHCFNGRMPSMYPYVEFARKYNIKYYLYEAGHKLDYLWQIENNVCHDLDNYKLEIKKYWEKGTDNKNLIACQWFNNRRPGSQSLNNHYTKKQTEGQLPKGFDRTKENIVFFNSSIDEIFAFPSWKHPFAKNENEILETLFEHYKDAENKHFYLRIHPNLTKAKKKNTTQIKQINNFKKRYKNLTVIEPDAKIDTYALMEAANKVITTYSTMGCEATYWGKVSIFIGRSLYEDLDCVYRANSYNELFDFIDNINLKPKPKENSYPFGYFYCSFGDKMKYFKPITTTKGEFMGKILKSK